MIKRLPRYLLPAILLLILYFMSSWFVRSIVYPSPEIKVSTAPAPLHEIILNVPESGMVSGWYYQSPKGEAPVLIYFHGNGENLETLRQSDLYGKLIELHATFLAVDYPGYGRSRGTSSESAINETASAAIQWMRKRNPRSRLITFGWSLGAAVALRSASHHPDLVDGVIAASAWSSLPDVAENHFPRWLVRMLLRESYDSRDAASRIRCPVLILHGAEDTLVPLEQAERIKGSIRSRSRLIKLDAGHNDLLAHPDVWKEIHSFLEHLQHHPIVSPS
jgi:pimeloyl-ACP methyl ester carboxylesterase